MNPVATLGNTAWLTASTLEWIRFRHASTSLEQTQRHRLKSYLKKNSGTEIGKAQKFGEIRDWEDYSEKVPIRSYEAFKPFIDRISSGVQNVLTKQRVSLLEPTSGSTGSAKLIPYTHSLQLEFRRAVASWMASTFLAHPKLLTGRAYWSLTPMIPEPEQYKTEIPVGFADDSAYLGGATQFLIQRILVTPPELGRVRDMDFYWRLTVLLLLKCRDLRLISVWHPSFINLILKYMQQNWGQLLLELRNGYAISHPELKVRPDIIRARELEHINPASPMEIWPQLELISCWTDANAANYLHDILSAFPGISLQPKGLLATESFVTIPLGDLRPLAIRSHFFEFLDDEGRVHASWQLKQGRHYTVIVTTGGGLYRYNLGDRVEVDGFWGQIPSLRFIGKDESVSDYFGEKLSEPFVSKVLKDLLETWCPNPGFAMLSLDDSGDQTAYTLYLETRTAIPKDLDARLDKALRENPHYDLCIRLGQLGATRVIPVADNSFHNYAMRLVAHGMRLGDVKPASLSHLKNWRDHLQVEPGAR